MASWRVDIPGYVPASTNRLMRLHWAQRNRVLKAEAELVAAYVLGAGVPRATGKRRVSIDISQARGRLMDPDNCLKGLIDHTVKAGALVDDSGEWCEVGAVRVSRGPRRTVIVLEDV